jgi:hypothetical protein
VWACSRRSSFSQSEREREREGERGRERKREGERGRESKREGKRKRETEGERERDKERERGRGRERDVVYGCFLIFKRDYRGLGTFQYKNSVTLYQLILCRGLRIKHFVSLASAAQPGCSKLT